MTSEQLATKTANPFAALLRDVPRYDGYWTFDPDGDVVRLSDVLAALAAAYPADLAEAGKVVERLRGRPDAIENVDRLRDEAADLITPLLARIAAQEAQMKADGERAAELMIQHMRRAEATETALAAMTKERDELRACIAWVDEVYPERIEAGGAGIHITWGEFNAMQAAIGVTVDKRIGGPEGKAAHNHRLRAALAAELAKVAKLVEALNQYQLAAAGYVSVRSAKDKADAVLSAIAEAGHE